MYAGEYVIVYYDSGGGDVLVGDYVLVVGGVGCYDVGVGVVVVVVVIIADIDVRIAVALRVADAVIASYVGDIGMLMSMVRMVAVLVLSV